MVGRWLPRSMLAAILLALTCGPGPAQGVVDADDERDSFTTEVTNPFRPGGSDPGSTDDGGSESVAVSCVGLPFVPVVLCATPCEQAVSVGGVWFRRAVDCRPTISVTAVRAQVAQQVRHRMPALAPQRQPAGRPALPRLPVVFSSGQDGGPMTWTDQLEGLSITTTVTPQWHWTFGDGEELTTSEPGGTWPDTSVSHSYDGKGNYPVQVTTTWDGSFTIAGVGTFPISGQVTQEASMQVPVRPARAVLVPQ